MRLWICAAAGNGFLALALGAYAAHGLGGGAEAELAGWLEAGSDTGLAHALALLGVGLLAGRTAQPRLTLRFAGWAFLAGTLLFSGTLYVMGLTGARALGPIVPAGGLLLMAGWLALFAYGFGLRRAPEVNTNPP